MSYESEAGTPDGDDEAGGARVFLSYSRKDRERAQGVADALRSRHFGVFRDTDDILPTEEWRDRLRQLIEEADNIVFLLSPHSATSEVCAWEVEYAASLEKRIAPIVIEDVPGEMIPSRLAQLNFIFCTPRDPFENAVDTLASALNTDIDWIREHTRIAGLAARWERAGRPARLLLRGQDIADAETWRDGRPKDAPAVTALQASFVGDSRRAAGRRQRNWIAGSLSAAAAAAGLAVFAWTQSVEADRQRATAEARLETSLINESRFLARRAVERAEAGDRPSAVRIALMGLPGEDRERPVTPEAEAALRLALSDFKRVAYLPPVKGNDRADRILSRNGRYSASFDGAGRLRATRLDDMTTVIDEDIGAVIAYPRFEAGEVILTVYHQDRFGSDARRTVETWDLRTGDRLLSLASTGNYAASPDGALFLMASGDSSEDMGLKVYRAADGALIGRIAPDEQRISNISFSPDGRHVLFLDGGGGTDGDYQIADPESLSHRPLPTIGDESEWWAEWIGDSDVLVTKGPRAGGVAFRIWRPPFDAPTLEIPVIADSAQDQLRVSDTLSLAAYSDTNGERTYIVDTATGEPIHTLNGYRLTRFFPGASAFAAYYGEDWDAEIFSVTGQARIGRLSSSAGVSDLVISADGARLVGRDGVGGVHIWEAPEHLAAPDIAGRAFSEIVRGVEFAPDGSALLAQTPHSSQVMTADLPSRVEPGRGLHAGEGAAARWELDRLDCPKRRYLERAISLRGLTVAKGALADLSCSGGVSFSADGASFASADRQVLQVVFTGADESAVRYELPFGFLTRPLFSPDGSHVLVTPAKGLGNSGMALFDLEEGREIPLERADETMTTSAAVFTPDGAKIIAPTKAGLSIWSAETGQIIGEVPPHGLRVDPDLGFRIHDLYMFSDGRRLFLKEFSDGWIIDIETGDVVNDRFPDGSFQAHAVSPDETLIAGGGFGDPEVRVFSVADGTQRARLAGFVGSSVSGSNGVTTIAFSPDGELIAAGSAAGRVRVWSYPRSLETLIEAAEKLVAGPAAEEALDIYGD